jgi:hypothetical protein
MRGKEEQTLAFFDTGILALYSSLLGLNLALWMRCVAFVGKGGREERQKFYRNVRR